MKALYKIWCILVGKCPNCGMKNALYCTGVSETENCRYCNWDEFDPIDN